MCEDTDISRGKMHIWKILHRVMRNVIEKCENILMKLEDDLTLKNSTKIAFSKFIRIAN